MKLKYIIVALLLGAVGYLVLSIGKPGEVLAETAPAPPAAQDAPRWHYKKGEPLQLRFTAVDGRKVDLEQLRGRVVLIDFWATWCGPCMEEVPHLRAAYQQFHDQGFEIIGISLDQDQAALKRVVAKEKMAWPHYFETKGPDNRIAAAVGIEEIPAMWLVDRNGFLRETNAVDNLSGKVQRLVAEKRSGPPSTSVNETQKTTKRPVDYLRLRGISGTASRRFVSIDTSLQNYVIREGSTATVRTPAGNIKVKCIEISENGARFEIEGEDGRKELWPPR